MVIICGTSLEGRSPGIVVPSSEQKQSGRTQTEGSHGGARLGSDSASVVTKTTLKINQRIVYEMMLIPKNQINTSSSS